MPFDVDAAIITDALDMTILARITSCYCSQAIALYSSTRKPYVA
jgi:hypothetical protein